MDVRQRSTLSIIPIFLSIAVYIFVASQIYTWTENNTLLTNVYDGAVGIGAIFMGFLSDSFCRRKTLIILHVLAPIFFTMCYLYQSSAIFFALFGLIYNPLSTVRANLVDNNREYSKIRLISYSFMVQFLPDSIYFLVGDFTRQVSYFWCLGAILFSLLIGLIFFFDRRDEKIKYENFFTKVALFAPKIGTRALLTFLAFIPTQISYFIADNLLSSYALNPLYYSMLSFGSLLGAGLSSMYKKIPHVSVLTIAYGVALLVSVLPLGARFIYGYQDLNIPYMFISLGTLVGFYISFVYDVILHSVHRHFRGTTCGVLDFVFSAESLMTLILYNQLAANIPLSLILIAVLFVVALILQKKAEAGSAPMEH